MEKGAGLLAAGCWFPQQQGLAWLHCEEAPLGKVAGKEDRRWLFQGLPFSEVVVAVNTREPLVLEAGREGALWDFTPPRGESARSGLWAVSSLFTCGPPSWGRCGKRRRADFPLMNLWLGDQHSHSPAWPLREGWLMPFSDLSMPQTAMAFLLLEFCASVAAAAVTLQLGLSGLYLILMPILPRGDLLSLVSPISPSYLPPLAHPHPLH